jgi:hypothetical protein
MLVTPRSLRRDPGARKIGTEAYFDAIDTFGFMERGKLSAMETAAVRDLARSKALELWKSISPGTPRPRLAAIFSVIDLWSASDSRRETDIRDKEWFSENPDRLFRVRMPFSHELTGFFKNQTMGYRACTIVLYNGPEDLTETMACLTKLGYPFDS